MDATRASLTVAALSDGDYEVRQRAARQLKNDVVGNGISKSIYVSVGAASALLLLVRSGRTGEMIEALSATASLAVRCAAGVTALLDADVVDALLLAMQGAEAAVVYSAVRALRVIVQAPVTPTPVLDGIGDSSAAVARLVELAARGGPVCADCTAVLACVVRTPAHAEEARDAGVLPILLLQLAQTAHPARTAAAIDALAAIALADQTASVEIAAKGAPLAALPFVRLGGPSLRLAACRLQARLRSSLTDDRIKSEVADAVVPELVRLLECKERSVRIAAPRVLAEMVANDQDMKQRAVDAHAVAKLATFFPQQDGVADGRSSGKKRIVARPGTNGKGELVRGIEVDKKLEFMPAAESAMIGIAELCDDQFSAIEQAVEKGVLPHVISYLGEQTPSVVLAAARCFRSLTCDVGIVRRDLGTGSVPGNVSKFLVRLLSCEDLETRQVVSRAVSNVVLSFSPIRPAFIEGGGIPAVARLLESDDQQLRMNSLRAIRNLLYMADVDVKHKVTAEVSYDALAEICSSPNPGMCQPAFRVMRNLACVGSVRGEIEHLDLLFARLGDRLLSVLTNFLEKALASGDDASAETAVHVLYLVNNLAVGAERHKMRVIESELPRLLLSWISHPYDRAQVAALWVVINLCHRDRPPIPRRSSSIRLPSRRRPDRLALLSAAHLPLPRNPGARFALERTPSPRSPQPAAHSEDDGDPPPLIPSEEEVEEHDDDSADPMTLDSETSEGASQDSIMVDVPHTPPRAAANRPVSSSTTSASRAPGLREGCDWRIERLREMGFEGKIRLLMNDAHIEVQGRARAALEQFSTSDINTLDYSPRSLLTRLTPSLPNSSAGMRPRGSPMMRIPRTAVVPQNASDDSGSNSDGSTLTATAEAINAVGELD